MTDENFSNAYWLLVDNFTAVRGRQKQRIARLYARRELGCVTFSQPECRNAKLKRPLTPHCSLGNPCASFGLLVTLCALPIRQVRSDGRLGTLKIREAFTLRCLTSVYTFARYFEVYNNCIFYGFGGFVCWDFYLYSAKTDDCY